MEFTRRQFVKGGISAFTIGFAAPQFLTDLAFAQAVPGRTLVILYLGGGNDALSTLIPYRDSAYYSRRPTLAVPAANVLQIGTDSSGIELGLHPRLTSFKSIFDQGRLAIMQRTGYLNSSRSHFQGFDIWGTANPSNSQGTGWLGRYLDTLPSPVDPLVAWNTTRETPRPLIARTVGVPAITNPATYSFSSPNMGNEAVLERAAAVKISSHLPVDRPHLSFVNSTAQAALSTLTQVARVADYQPTRTYPANNALALALRAVAGAMNKQIGTKVFWVQIGGFDTHASQGTNVGTYANLMTALNDAVAAFYEDLNNQGLLGNTLVIVFSEFGRRISENGTPANAGSDHGAAGLMMALGGTVRGGIYGTAADLRLDPANPTLERDGGDVRFETDFRSVYARVIDNWLGANSIDLLGGDFKAGAPGFL